MVFVFLINLSSDRCTASFKLWSESRKSLNNLSTFFHWNLSQHLQTINNDGAVSAVSNMDFNIFYIFLFCNQLSFTFTLLPSMQIFHFNYLLAEIKSHLDPLQSFPFYSSIKKSSYSTQTSFTNKSLTSHFLRPSQFFSSNTTNKKNQDNNSLVINFTWMLG